MAVTRQIVAAGSQWAIRAPDVAALDVVVDRFRATAPRVTFTADSDQRSAVKKIEQNRVNAVHVSYVTPVQSAATGYGPPPLAQPTSSPTVSSTSAAPEGLRPDPPDTQKPWHEPIPSPQLTQAINSPSEAPWARPPDASFSATSTVGAPSVFEPPDHEESEESEEVFTSENTGRMLPWLRRAFAREYQGEPPRQRSTAASDIDESTNSSRRTLPWRRRSAK